MKNEFVTYKNNQKFMKPFPIFSLNINVACTLPATDQYTPSPLIFKS